MITIRRAEPDDAEEILAMIRAHAAFERSNAPITLEQLRVLLAPGLAIQILLACGHDGPLGYAALTFDTALWRAERYAHLDCLYVREGHRGEGLGKRLLMAVADVARSAGCRRLEWQTPQWNSDAIRFYEREGGWHEAKARFHLDL